jgi:hypothetical protein
MTMTLTQLANESNKQDDDKRRAAREEQHRKIMANAEARIAKVTGSLDVTPVFLDTQVETTLTVYRKGASTRAARSSSTASTATAWTTSSCGRRPAPAATAPAAYAPEIGYLALERDCDCCGRTTGVELHVYGYGDPDYAAKEFVRQLGIALRQRVTCSFCAAEVSQPCPTCGHTDR